MLFAQISDLHIKRPGKLAYRRVDTAAYLTRCVARLNTLAPRPDFVVLTGDLVDFGAREEYDHLRSLLAPLEIPYYLVIGNHDGRDALREVFPEHTYLGNPGEFVQYAATFGPMRLVALDTQDPPNGGGRLCDARLQWLEATLAADTGTPTVIAMHHPPFVCGIEHMDVQSLDAADAAKLAAVVRRFDNVERVICGHVHRPIHTRFAGTIASVCPSPAHQVALDLRDGGPSAWVLDPPAFELHRFTPSTGLVSHLAFVDDAGGAHPFYDASGALID
ncbi:metallophosphatase [Pandoraea pnomenusa]|uniref:3',5'-cyclic adenosine monophosphate phosphodiesterase CpdA n=1 Tax=Pandoraea pnomenusa TaxID=93220 RepID=A0A378YHG9_9BURK|nr:phosphodiesterase [Pandoraea pnomenusa]AIU26265.1 metallophosphatase [Pandoraea pnomenusa]SUA76288.1 3',5'-cyclic adenosine monophosphate phosphodiesterase CpdA [Pandoraea pnomenusa]